MLRLGRPPSVYHAPRRFSLQSALRAIPGMHLSFNEVPRRFYALNGTAVEIECPCQQSSMLTVEAGRRGERALECSGCDRVYVFDGVRLYAVGGIRVVA